ncbi:nuclear transport factor 2 family protein [Rhodococcus opacus]|uniref:nuclear transport factor 2 family protein n=1 Tax=Rhodococcus opacus TaxID=37919 RepID=UPI001C488B82|nr:nuclear transport factor 2 family protein [Rhodococcus opacus]MBV6761128.1 nuclear transport factor 2 family protein [Rhodococcus opacus]
MLDDIEQIKRLKSRYFRFMDTKDWESYRTVFTEDVLFDVRGGMEATTPGAVYEEPPVTGRDAAVDLIRTSLDGMVSAHQGYLPEIEILSPEAAQGTWAMTDVLRAGVGAPFRTMRGYGHYHETYRRVDGEWRIATLRLTRLLVDVD